MVRSIVAAGWLLVACKNGGADGPAAGAEPKSPAPVSAPPPSAPVAAPLEPKSLYAECHDRLELPQGEGECKADTDCAVSGCGKEVCTTVKGATDLMTTCENKPCFTVVENCGCHAGACTWNLKAEMPAVPPPLPRSLPSAGPPQPPAPAP